MEEKIKVSYEQIEKANKEIETVKLGTKGYAQVNERIKAYRKVYPTGSLTSEIQEIRDDYVRIKATATDEQDRVIATGTASEKLTGDGKKDYINISSMIENCETSAFGRCLGFAGFGVDTAIASAEDMEKAKAQNKVFEIYDKMTIRDDEAKYIVKVVIGDLMRKQGVVKESLNTLVQQKLWTTLEEMNTRQLMILENKLKTINQEKDEWHELYNENSKIKDVVPVNQEVVYESSWYKFGQLALQMAGTDELLRNDIINSYIDMGINLEKKMDNIYIRKVDLYKYKATYELFDKLFRNLDLISIDDLISKIEDLADEVDELKGKIEELENEESEPINDPYDYYGVSRNDF